VTFIGDAMAAVVQGAEEVRTLIGQPPPGSSSTSTYDPLH
jgi:hypothetical protein